MLLVSACAYRGYIETKRTDVDPQRQFENYRILTKNALHGGDGRERLVVPMQEVRSRAVHVVPVPERFLQPVWRIPNIDVSNSSCARSASSGLLSLL